MQRINQYFIDIIIGDLYFILMTKIVDLTSFRRQTAIKSVASKDERVWDRVERTQSIFTSGAFTNDTMRRDAWNNAAEALLQYMNNEWPIEKENACRADQIAEYAATLFVMGTFDRQLSNKALEVQDMALEGFDETSLIKARHTYGNFVGNLMNSLMMNCAAVPQ